MITPTMSWVEAIAIILCLTGAIAFMWTLREAVKDKGALSKAQITNGRGTLARGVVRGEAILLATMLVFLFIAVQGALSVEPLRPSTVLWASMVRGGIILFIVAAVWHSLLSMKERRHYIEVHMDADTDTGPLYPHQIDKTTTTTTTTSTTKNNNRGRGSHTTSDSKSTSRTRTHSESSGSDEDVSPAVLITEALHRDMEADAEAEGVNQ